MAVFLVTLMRYRNITSVKRYLRKVKITFHVKENLKEL